MAAGHEDGVDQLVNTLVRSGFTVDVDSRGDMGGRSIRLKSGKHVLQPVVIEVSGDRGRWSLGLQVGSMPRPVPPNIWRAVADDVNPQDPDFEGDAAYLASNLEPLVAAYDSGSIVLGVLELGGENYMRRKLGTPLRAD